MALGAFSDLQAALQPGLSPYTTPADDAYHYYGSKNPLESNGYGEDLLVGELGSKAIPSARAAGGGGRVRFDAVPPAGAAPGLFAPGSGDVAERKANQQKEYAQVLQQQMEEVSKFAWKFLSP